MHADFIRQFPKLGGAVREVVEQGWPKGAPFSFQGRAALQANLTWPMDHVFLAGDYLEFPCMDSAIPTGLEAASRIEVSLAQAGRPAAS